MHKLAQCTSFKGMYIKVYKHKSKTLLHVIILGDLSNERKLFVSENEIFTSLRERKKGEEKSKTHLTVKR
jgi:hypothetical protein